MKRKTSITPWEAQSCNFAADKEEEVLWSKTSWANKKAVSVQNTGIINIYS